MKKIFIIGALVLFYAFGTNSFANAAKLGDIVVSYATICGQECGYYFRWQSFTQNFVGQNIDVKLYRQDFTYIPFQYAEPRPYNESCNNGYCEYGISQYHWFSMGQWDAYWDPRQYILMVYIGSDYYESQPMSFVGNYFSGVYGEFLTPTPTTSPTPTITISPTPNPTSPPTTPQPTPINGSTVHADENVIAQTTGLISGVKNAATANLSTLLPYAAILLISVAVVYFVLKKFRHISKTPNQLKHRKQYKKYKHKKK